MTEDRTGPDVPRFAREPGEPLAIVRETLDRLKFGAILLTVHDGRLVQVEVTEKLRFAA